MLLNLLGRCQRRLSNCPKAVLHVEGGPGGGLLHSGAEARGVILVSFFPIGCRPLQSQRAALRPRPKDGGRWQYVVLLVISGDRTRGGEFPAPTCIGLLMCEGCSVQRLSDGLRGFQLVPAYPNGASLSAIRTSVGNR